MKKFDEDNSSNNTISRINNYPYTSRDLSKFNTGTNLEKIILKNKVNKIIKIYRNYHKKRDLNSFASTRNNTDRLQENNSLKNLLSQKNLNSPSNNNNTNNNDNNQNNVNQNDDGNYTATRTEGESTFMGMNSNTWSWLILGIAAVAIIALVWYYSMQLNNDRHNNNRDE